MKAYLLDTNVISDWFDSRHERHEAVSARAREKAQAGDQLWTSVVVIAEIEYGIRTATKDSKDGLNEFRSEVHSEFVHNHLLLNISHHTAVIHGALRAELFEEYSDKRKRKKSRRPEELVCPTTSRELGIQENDLWIVAQAIERNATLVTRDNAMGRIWKVVPELTVEDWST